MKLVNLVALAVTFLVAVNAFAAELPEPADQVAEECEAALALPKVTPYLFAIEKDGRTAMILGTRHLGVALHEMPDIVSAAINAAPVIVQEMAPKTGLAEAIKNLRMGLNSMRLSGPKYTEALSPAAYKFLSERLAKQGLKPELLEWLTPSIAGMLLDLDNEQLATGKLDQELAQRAALQGIPVVGLESFGRQNRLVSNLYSMEQLETELQRRILTPDSGAELREFKRGDAATLESRATRFKAERPDLYQSMVVDRNKAWLPKVESLMRKYQNVFFAVGAGHLGGPDGLIRLLEQRGYRVTRRGARPCFESQCDSKQGLAPSGGHP